MGVFCWSWWWFCNGEGFFELLEKRWVEWLLEGECLGCLLIWDVHKEEGGLGYVYRWCWNNVATEMGLVGS